VLTVHCLLLCVICAPTPGMTDSNLLELFEIFSQRRRRRYGPTKSLAPESINVFCDFIVFPLVTRWYNAHLQCRHLESYTVVTFRFPTLFLTSASFVANTFEVDATHKK